jgi:hypothetical protein
MPLLAMPNMVPASSNDASTFSGSTDNTAVRFFYLSITKQIAKHL